MAIKNVVVAGASGNVGAAVITALIASQKFHITAFTRSNSNKTPKFPPEVTVVAVDYDDPSSLTAALKGQDAIVSALDVTARSQQRTLLDAAVAAGVHRFLPSEFGGDVENPKTGNLTFFHGKRDDGAYIASLAAEGKITYTNVVTGPFLDYGLDTGFMGLDLRKRQVTYYDDGRSTFSATSLPTVGKAVVGVLANPAATKNRSVRVQDVALTMRELFRLTKEALGSEGWTEVDGGTSEAVKDASDERMKKGEFSLEVAVGFLMAAIYGEGYGGHFQKLDNDVLGIGQFSEKDVIELIKEVAKKQSS